MTTVQLSGNDVGWLTVVAEKIMDAGTKPASVDYLLRVVPREIATAHNDGHVTAAESGLDRNDFQAGWRIWVTEAVGALRRAKLVDGPDDALRWSAAADGEWKVPFGARKRPVTVRGKAQRRAARDRHMLGERGEKDTTPTRPGLVLEGRSHPLKVHVRKGITSVIEKGENELDVHPLALAIPPMTAAEQEAVRADIERHGVKVPVVLFPDKDDLTVRGKPRWKVLDGRHRVYFASQTGQPIDVEVFKGTDDEARAHVASLNLHRRQLNPAQKHTAAVLLFGEESREEAAENRKRKPKHADSARGKSPEQNGDQNGGAAWYELTAEKAGGKAAGITPDGVKHAATIARAPETLAKVQAGEPGYTKIAPAVRKAEIELGLRAPDEPVAPNEKVRAYPVTIYTQLGKVQGCLLSVLEENGMPLGTSDVGTMEERLERLKLLLAQVEIQVRKRL